MPQQLQRQQQERESQQDQQQLLLQAVRDIHEAEFIAVDLAQIGICCVRRDEENPTRWLLHPYTFDAHPRALQQRLQQKGGKLRSSNSSSGDGAAVSGGCGSSILQGANGSGTATAECEKALPVGLKQVVEDVGDVTAELRGLTNTKAEERSIGDKSSSDVGGLSVLAGALIEAGAPLVFHNGLLDLLHILEKFVEEVPPTLEGFAAEVCSTALQALRNHLLASPGLLCCFDIAESCKGRFNFSFKELNVPNELPEARSHEAGFDALATAQVFVCLAAAAAKQQQQDVCLSLLRDGRDVIGVAGVKPGYLRLRNFLPEETSPLLSALSDRRDSSNKETGDGRNGYSGRDVTKPKTNKRDRHCSDSSPPLCAVRDAVTGVADPASGETAESPVARAPRRMRVTP
ncbi:hypothetical protein Emag_003908 [Eimeria magna]